MATVDTTLIGVLKATAAVTALLGTNPTRLYPDTIESAIRPAVAYQRISNPRVRSLAGDSGLGRVRIQFTLFARSASERAALNVALRNAIDSYTDRNAGGVIENVAYDATRDQYDPLTKDYLAFVDFLIWHIEA
jgi:hypothetical protein